MSLELFIYGQHLLHFLFLISPSHICLQHYRTVWSVLPSEEFPIATLLLMERRCSDPIEMVPEENQLLNFLSSSPLPVDQDRLSGASFKAKALRSEPAFSRKRRLLNFTPAVVKLATSFIFSTLIDGYDGSRR